jgi:hypothetical protein
MTIAFPIIEDMVKKSDILATKGDFSMLDELHHFTSGFKSLYTNFAYFGIDELRQSCGGAGFTLSS